MTDMMLAFARNGHHDTVLIPKEYTWEQFAQRMSKPSLGEKDGSYIIRGGVLKEAHRANDNLLEAELLVIDGDSSFDPQTGEVFTGIDPDEPDERKRIKGNCTPIEVARDALDKLGYRYIIHTTHTHTPGILNKWRAYIPAKMKSPEELKAAVAYVIAQMHAKGCFVEANDESTVWAQPWYLPRVKPKYIDSYRCYASLSGSDVNVAAAVDLALREQEAEARVRAEQAKERPKLDGVQQGPSPIEMYNMAVDANTVRAMLEGAGYKFAFQRKGVMRFEAPGSTTKTAGVSVMKGKKKGDVVVYSHHGAHDPLSHRLTDAFGLLTRLYHGGNEAAALEEAKQAIGWEKNRGVNLEDFDVEITPEVFKQARQEGEAPAAGQGDRFQWLTSANGYTPVLNSNWLIKRLLPAEGLGVIFGRPGSGKTFSVMDLAMHVATGTAWRGLKVTPAAVSYISPEAGRLGANRVIGWCRHHGIAWPDTFRLSPAQINLCSTEADAKALIDDIRQNQPGCRLVVIDTLNRALAGGDENDGQDMGKFVRLCDLIAKELQAFVLVVHHSGKDASRGSRGHSSLLGAVSLELEVTREQKHPGVIKVTKMRDGEDGMEYGFDIESVELGQDEDGETVSTGISTEADAGEARAVREAKPQGINQHTIVAAFDQLLLDEGTPTPFGTGFPEAGRYLCVGTDKLIGFAVGKMASGGKDYTKRKAMGDAMEALLRKGYFATNGGYTWKLV